MKKIIFSFLIASSAFVSAQVGISPNTTDTPRATLDVRPMNTDGSTVEGILIPQVSKAAAQAMSSSTIVTSTMIYVNDATATNGSITGKVDAVGFYYYDGTEWVKVGGSGGASSPVVDTYTTSTYTLSTNADYVIYTPTAGASTVTLGTSSPDGRRVCLFNKSLDNNLSFSVNPGGGKTNLFPNDGACFVSYSGAWYGISGY